jgi:hypothetical protein
MPGGLSLTVNNTNNEMNEFTKRQVKHQAVLLYI